MTPDEHQPGEPAPLPGHYEELNIFGTPTGRIAMVGAGDNLPDAPRGFVWRSLSIRAPGELRARAEEYRRMADTARTATVAESLRKLAGRFDALAGQREAEERGEG
jgi:hypothetical protein